MKIQGIEGLTPEQVRGELERGGKFILYRYCVSVVVLTFRRPTDVYFVKGGENRVVKGLPWTLLTLFLGWWGIPWGPIYSVQCLYRNLAGGEDVTNQIQNSLARPVPQPPPLS